MKSLVYGILSFFVLAALGAVVFYRLQPSLKGVDKAPVAAAPAPQQALLSNGLETSDAVDMPPAKAGGGFPAVNQQRLRTLAASDYEGPAYTADYSRYEMIAAQKKGFGDRSPASEKKKKGPKSK